jgi:hypothetical protein
MRNKYPGICYRCGLYCGKNEGHFERYTNEHGVRAFRVQHAQCAIKFRSNGKYGQINRNIE